MSQCKTWAGGEGEKGTPIITGVHDFSHLKQTAFVDGNIFQYLSDLQYCFKTVNKDRIHAAPDSFENAGLFLCRVRPTVHTYSSRKRSFLKMLFSPLTPVPAIIGLDEPRPFFHFWCHPFWPKLASPILNFCRKKTSFQWCPNQGDWPNGARDMHKNAQKVEWKTRSKISCHYTWLLHR